LTKSGQKCEIVNIQSAAICEASGMAPSSSIVDVCIRAVPSFCVSISTDVASGKPIDADTLCSTTSMCGTNGSRCGCLAAGDCAVSSQDCCSGKSHFTLACGGERCD
jgi:hypothetical protein